MLEAVDILRGMLTTYRTIVLLCMVLGLGIKGDVYIRHGPKHQRIRAGMVVTFRCTAGTDTLLDGVPEIDWEKDDVRIHYGKDISLGRDSVGNTLTIRNASTEDTGLYTCTARSGEDRSSASAQLIVEDVPDPPVNVTLTQCENRVAQLSWRLISENYSPVLQFIIEYNTSFSPDTWHVAKTLLQRNRFFQRITLSPYANYSFRVIAQNQIGNSLPSLPTHKICRMPPDVPHHNPKGVCTLNVRPKTLVIKWEVVPQGEQNAPGYYYLVKWRRHDLANNQPFQREILEQDVDTLTIENQPTYKEYEIYVLSVNEVGEAVSPPQMVLGFSAEEPPKETPQNFRLHPEKDLTATTADFKWDAVNTGPWQMRGFFRGYKIEFWKTEDGKSSLREHTIIFREPGPCWRESTRQKRDTTTGHMYNLWPYTNITAQIRALNAKYEGPPSYPLLQFRTAEGVPGSVQDLQVSGRGPTYLALQWSRPAVVNGVLTGYFLSYTVVSVMEESSTMETDLLDPAQTEVELRGLVPDQLYRLSIVAHTAAGPGEADWVEQATLPAGAPVAPNFTTMNVDKRTVNVTWVPSAPGNPGTVFTVEYRVKGDLLWQKSSEIRERSWEVLEGLSPDKLYELRVVARNGDDVTCPQTSSVVRTVQIGRKRELSEPTFQMVYISDQTFAIGLVNLSREVNAFYVQYKPTGALYWRSTDDTPVDKFARLDELEVGKTYQVRVVARSSHGDTPSLIRELTAGNNADAQPSISRGNSRAARGTRVSGTLLLMGTAVLSVTLPYLLCHSPLHISTYREPLS